MELELEFGLREYLLILGILLIVGLLVDGVRRTLKHKREGLKLDLMAAPPESPERSDVSKPRSVKKIMPQDLEPKVNADPLFDSSDISQLNLWAGEIKAQAMKATDAETLMKEPARDNLTEPLFEGYQPIKSQDPIHPENGLSNLETTQRVEPTWLVDSAETKDFLDSPGMVKELEDQPDIEVVQNSGDGQLIETENTIYDEDIKILADGPVSEPILKEIEPNFLNSTLGKIFIHFKKKDSKNPSENVDSQSINTGDLELDESFKSESSDVELTDKSMTDLVLVSIKSLRAEKIIGGNLNKACLRAGLRWSQSKIYQRFPLDESEHSLFSLVNGIEPGIFEGDMESIDLSILFLFTELSKQSDPVFAVNELISGARSIARDIGCDVFDLSGTPISKAWIDLARAQASHFYLIRS